MDSEFLKMLSQMAEEELTKDNISNATHTANQLEQLIAADSSSEHTFMPSYLKEQIINRAHQPDIQLEKSSKKIPKQLELFIFSCKVSAAVAASILIMATATVTQSKFTSSDVLKSDSQQCKKADVDIPDTVMEHLNNGSLMVTSWLQSLSTTIMRDEKTEK